MKGREFLTAVLSLSAEISNLAQEASRVAVRQAAIALAHKGFTKLEQISLIPPEEAARWAVHLAAAAALREVAVQIGRIAATQAARADAAQVCVSSSCNSCSAEEVAACLVPALQADARAHTVALVEDLAGVTIGQCGPAAIAQGLSSAGTSSKQIEAALDARAMQLALATKGRSLPSVASALKNWHTFAVGFLGYAPVASLPPRCEDHVLRWVATFKNFGTASNYIGAVRWASVAYGLNISWDTERVQLVLRGGRKLAVQSAGSTLHVPFHLTTQLVRAVAELAGNVNNMAYLGPLLLVGWEFLFRMQSECFPLELGRQEDLATIPAGRHSAVVVLHTKTPSLAIRLRRRKHRPAGSLLVRSCNCKPGSISNFCVVHRVTAWVSASALLPGQKLWANATQACALTHMRRLLTLLGTPDAHQCSWKAVRSGRATEMAADGFTLAKILEAGEWRSSAFLRYIDETAADQGQSLRAALEENDED